MTLKPEPRTVNNDLTDLFKRVRRLEAVPPGGGDCDCQCIEAEYNRALYIDRGNYIGYEGDPWEDGHRINTFQADSSMENAGYYSPLSGSYEVGDVALWTVWLGPTGSRYRFNMVSQMGTDSGRVSLYLERLVETSPGLWERESAPVDVFGGYFADLYASSTTPNLWNVSYDFGIGGADCDTPFTSVDDSPPWGYELNGGPSFYRMWLMIEGANGSSTGLACRLQTAWLKRLSIDEG